MQLIHYIVMNYGFQTIKHIRILQEMEEDTKASNDNVLCSCSN